MNVELPTPRAAEDEKPAENAPAAAQGETNRELSLPARRISKRTMQNNSSEQPADEGLEQPT